MDQAKIIDALGILEDGAAAIVASGAGSDEFVFGSGFKEAKLVIDVSAMATATGDEVYTIALQVGAVSGFGSGAMVEAAQLTLGDATALIGDADLGVGRWVLPVTNGLGGTVYKYARIYVTVVGAGSPSITFTAYLSK